LSSPFLYYLQNVHKAAQILGVWTDGGGERGTSAKPVSLDPEIRKRPNSTRLFGRGA